MRPTREKARENRQRIIETASRLFREKGIHAVGVDAIMKSAGLTHGGFYGHFKSKEELTDAALRHGMADRMGSERPYASLQDLVGAYLSAAHRDDAGSGCAVAALGPEISRLAQGTRGGVTAYVEDRIRQMADLGTAAGPDARRDAIASLSSLVGAVLMARAVEDADLSAEILRETEAAILSRQGD